MKRKLISVLLVLLVVSTVLVFPVSAASQKTVYPTARRGWSADVTCTLTKGWFGGTKSGVVRVTIPNYGVNVDIRMRNGSKVIWSENNSIYGSNRSAYTSRDYNLGNDHSYYNLSFRCSKNCACAPYVTVKSIKNCNIS